MTGTAHEYAVRHRDVRFTGSMFSVVSDDVEMPGGTHAVRDFVRHIGAVGVVALDAQGRVVLVRQYRHPTGAFLWELPAGLVGAAIERQRELRFPIDETNLHAEPVDED